jgi:hypothetical protein
MRRRSACRDLAFLAGLVAADAAVAGPEGRESHGHQLMWRYSPNPRRVPRSTVVGIEVASVHGPWHTDRASLRARDLRDDQPDAIEVMTQRIDRLFRPANSGRPGARMQEVCGSCW